MEDNPLLDPAQTGNRRADVVAAMMAGYRINPEMFRPQVNFAQPGPQQPMQQLFPDIPGLTLDAPPHKRAQPAYAPFSATQNIVNAARLKGLFGVGTQSPAPVSDAVPSWWAPGAT